MLHFESQGEMAMSSTTRTSKSALDGLLILLCMGASTTAACMASGNDGSDPTCSQECAAELAVPCVGAATTADQCVASCEKVRASRSACLSQDTAFRECFAQGPIECSSG